MTFRQQISTKQCAVSRVTSTSARNGQGSAHEIHKVSIMGTTAVNCQTRKTRFEQCSQLFSFKPREIRSPTFMEFLSSKAVMLRLTRKERWRATGMLQDGSNQLNVARQFKVSQSDINSSETWTSITGQTGYIFSLLMAVL